MALSDIDSNEMYRLRWQGSNSVVDLTTEFRKFRENEELFDASLVCSVADGGTATLKAHQLILAAYSPVFKDVFTGLKDTKDPCIYLKGISQNNLSAVLDFMYHGSVDIPKSKMPAFLADAQELQIKGLKFDNAEDAKTDDANITCPTSTSTPKPRGLPKAKSLVKTKALSKILPKPSPSKPKISNKRIKMEPEETKMDLGESLNQEKNMQVPGSLETSLKRVKRAPKKRKVQTMEDSLLGQSLIDAMNSAQINGNSTIQSEGNVLDDTFENVDGKWVATGTKKRTLSRCKLCLKEVRRDKRSQHLRAMHRTQAAPTTTDKEC